MLWLIVILVIGGLLFVLFHKPHVNSMGVGWIPPEQRQVPSARPPVAPTVAADGQGGQTVNMPAQLPGTFNFDPHAAAPPTSTDQPHS